MVTWLRTPGAEGAVGAGGSKPTIYIQQSEEWSWQRILLGRLPELQGAHRAVAHTCLNLLLSKNYMGFAINVYKQKTEDALDKQCKMMATKTVTKKAFAHWRK